MCNHYFYISLTTIPSRFNKINICIDSLLNQSIKPHKIIINIPRMYSFRFKNSVLACDIINLINKYSYTNIVYINIIDNDYGPGTKLIGTLISNIIEKDNAHIILVDDDITYDKWFLEGFIPYINNQSVTTYYKYIYDGIIVGQGVDGLMIPFNLLRHFLSYYDKIKDNEFINFHDDVYISFYFKILGIQINSVNIDKTIYSSYNNCDSLSEINGDFARDNITQKIISFLKKCDTNKEFDFMKI
jgi:hypothetical protein